MAVPRLVHNALEQNTRCLFSPLMQLKNYTRLVLHFFTLGYCVSEKENKSMFSAKHSSLARS
ncbi:hypothetical protein EXN66_Car012684 [Channa argus]|uniref:Uncharacterized protein n=1 Tax=Channa argus TaxID=215402 RepID=A0A6G1Q3N2_CHAAH|nr:hypothetical protein EXN66_Car012684 [Channa argus]